MSFYILLNFNKYIINYKLFTAIEILFGIVISTLYIMLRNRVYYSSNIIYRRGKRPWRYSRPSYIMSYLGGFLISIFILSTLNIKFNKGIINSELYNVVKIGSNQIRYTSVDYIIVENSNTHKRKKFYIGSLEKYKISQRVIVTTIKGFLGFDYTEISSYNKRKLKENRD